MKLSNDIELVDLALYTNNILVVSDFHIGFEEALNKQGLLVPRFQFPEIIKKLDNIFLKLKGKIIDKIVICGDLKHEFGTISEQEWRHTLQLLDYFGKRCNEVVLIKGNHDTILGPIAKKRDVKVLDYYVIGPINKETPTQKSIDHSINKFSTNDFNNKKELIKNQSKIINIAKKSLKNLIQKNKKQSGRILCLHGDKIPNKELLKDVSTIIIGHEHPAVSIKEGPRAELFKAFLIGKWKDKRIIVLPSFNLVVEGTDVLKERSLSPFLKGSLGNFNVVVVGDKLYEFGKIKDL